MFNFYIICSHTILQHILYKIRCEISIYEKSCHKATTFILAVFVKILGRKKRANSLRFESFTKKSSIIFRNSFCNNNITSAVKKVSSYSLAVYKSAIFVKLHSLAALSTISQGSSMRFKAGVCSGHRSTFTLLSVSQLFVIRTESSIIFVHKNLIVVHFIDGSIEPDNKLQCLPAVITPTTLNFGPTTSQAKLDRTIIDRLLCLTAWT